MSFNINLRNGGGGFNIALAQASVSIYGTASGTATVSSSIVFEHAIHGSTTSTSTVSSLVVYADIISGIINGTSDVTSLIEIHEVLDVLPEIVAGTSTVDAITDIIDHNLYFSPFATCVSSITVISSSITTDFFQDFSPFTISNSSITVSGSTEIGHIWIAHGTSTATALFEPAVYLAGLAEGIATVDALLQPAVYLAGLAEGTSTADAIFEPKCYLAGLAEGIATVDAIFQPECYLAGLAEGIATVDALFEPVAYLAGLSEGTSTVETQSNVIVPVDGFIADAGIKIGKRHVPIYLQKDPDASRDYTFDFRPWLNGNTFEFVQLVAPIGYDQPLWSYTEHTATAWLSYDQNGDYLPLTWHCRTRDGRVDDITFNLSIEQAA